jgi:hypothetical protein
MTIARRMPLVHGCTKGRANRRKWEGVEIARTGRIAKLTMENGGSVL